jgi:trimeric autotransporter adhesin
MNRKLRVALLCACLALAGTMAVAATTAVTVYPNPIQFGIVALNSPSQPLYIYVSNTSVNAITVSNMTISGTNSASFAFYGSPCIGTISAEQTCEMFMTFTPSAMGNVSATLVITETGLASPINIPLQGAGGNPIPNVTSVSPPTVYVDSPTTKITMTGTGFLSSTLAYLQNNNSSTPLPTTYVSATQITALIPDTVLSSAGTVDLYVTNPAPGGGSSSTSIQVVSAEPSIGSITPASIVAGTASELIVISGQNFMSGAKVEWNGVSIPTTYINSGQLQVQPTTAELATAGMVQLAVANPSPGTISPATSFNVTYPVTLTVLDLPANDIIWDPFAQLIYASMPSSYGTNGNTIAVINPSTGAVTGYYFAGSEPTQLALDSSSEYLYVGLNGVGAVQQLNLPSFTAGNQISLGTSTNDGVNLAEALAVSPSNSQTIAVALSGGCCPEEGPIEFFTGTTKLADSVTTEYAEQLVFASGTTLYGYYPNVLNQITVGSSGGTVAQTWSDVVEGNTFLYSGGLIFGSDGQEFNPATGLLLGTFDVLPSPCCNYGTEVLPNSSLNRAFALGATPFFDAFSITSYNLTQFTPLAVANLSELSTSGYSTSSSHFIQWGSSGLAFILTNGCCGTTTSQVVLLQSPTLLLAATKTRSPAPVSNSLNPSSVSHGSKNFRMTVGGSGFMPGSIVTWNGKAHSASFVNENEMTVYVPAAEVASSGTASIEVKNPAPGGGKSNTLTFTIK